MKVILKRPFHCGKLYKPRPGGTDIPDNLRKFLPKDAKVIGEKEDESKKDESKKDDPKKTKLDL